MDVDMADLSMPACRSCLVSLKKEPVIPVTPDGEPVVIAKFRKIAKDGAAGIRYEGRSYTIDSYSASAVVVVWDKLSEENKKEWMAKHKGNPALMANLAFTLINRANAAA
jgi:hypothetical protein